MNLFRETFFGALPDLNRGSGCIKVDIEEGDAIIIPANYPHFVEAHGQCVVNACNFITLEQLPQAITAYKIEYGNKDVRNQCFPHFKSLALLVLGRHMYTWKKDHDFTIHYFMDAITHIDMGKVDNKFITQGSRSTIKIHVIFTLSEGGNRMSCSC